ncbi:MAG: hypothetical protein JO276_14475 [Sphingomonadaceae bacterium]|nr:hypothetical protein [Sphingomonadaceae bacterium]
MGHDRNWILPLPLRARLHAIGIGLADGTVDADDARAAVEMMAMLPLRNLSQSINEVRHHGRLFVPSVEVAPTRVLSQLFNFLRSDASHAEQLARTPGLEYLFLCHSSGYLREAALHKLDGPLSTPFMVGLVVDRLNDWVPQVRRAARETLARTTATTDPQIIASAALHLLVRTESWRRWRCEAEGFADLLAREDVARSLADAISAAPTGPMMRILRAAMRRPVLDGFLLDLFQRARQPAVRAMVLKAMLEGKASWAEGTEKKWIDKSLGLFRHGPAWRERPIERPLPMFRLIELGLMDRTAAVRKVAASGLIAHFDAIPKARTLAERLLRDRSPAVRERAAFALSRSGAPA